MWGGWLIVIASAPDIDYLVPALNSRAHHGIRITHSVTFSLILPLCTAVILYLAGKRGRELMALSACASLAGLSHLVLDFLVGVTPRPLLWPLSAATFASPVGILPSAGKLHLSNYYFYRNLIIEVGVLAPLAFVASGLYRGKTSVQNWIKIILLLIIAGSFIVWSLSLSR